MRHKTVSAGLLLLGIAAIADADNSVTRLTNIINSYPDPSPDGRLIAFQSNRTGTPQIYVMNADGTDVKQLTDDPRGAETPVWSPNGQTIVYGAYVADDNNDVFVMKADGSERKRLTSGPGYDGHPHWSFDGARIIFNSDRASPDLRADWSNRWHEIFSMSADGSDVRQHTTCQSICTYGSLSPDGRKILYRKVTDTAAYSWGLTLGTRNSEVFIADLDGSNEVNLTNSAAFDGWPAWSPNGERIVFSSNRNGPANVGHLYTVRIDGTDLHKVTGGTWSYVQPAWSTDGKQLFAYQNQENEEYEFGDIVVVGLQN
jgi:TolB protein